MPVGGAYGNLKNPENLIPWGSHSPISAKNIVGFDKGNVKN
jgi:hypothetical protein